MKDLTMDRKNNPNILTVKRLLLLCICICMMLSLSACKITSNKKISEEELNEMKAEYEAYLAEKYPDETFTVEIWQEYGLDIGAAGLPDYEGYLIRQVVTDSEGNHFKIHTYPKGVLDDDYQDVLDGKIHYNEKGQEVYYKDNGEIWFVSDR